MAITGNSLPKLPETPCSQLQTCTSTIRLNQIEKIRANGVGDLVALPQLVVCGDQSAGKSSTLERITGIPFPRKDGLCTRFPTEIILRNDPSSEAITITATIRPHVSRTVEVEKALSAYRRVVEDILELPSIIEEVSRLMNIRGYTDDVNSLAFASDALRIEITGKTGLHLSVVDLPGLISVANEEQSEEDVEAVHAMVNSYLQSTRTIALTVLQAGNDMANQPIIKVARTHDPDGQRTVGIITKPDLINVGAESRIALVAKNEDSIKLKLGFFLLKNPTPSELKKGISVERMSRGESSFFSLPQWKSQNLDMDRVGADKLRLFLQDLLDAHIERELPKVRLEIKKKLHSTEIELRALGSARPTIGLIRSFLTDLSNEFSRLIQAAFDGSYDSVDVEFFSRHDICRLRAQAHKRNTSFATYMREHGQKRKISSKPKTSVSDGELANKTNQLIVNEAEMRQWVKKAYLRTRGRELPGSHNSALLSELFHEQSERWYSIARDHVEDILDMVSKWVDHGVQAVTPEESLRCEIRTMLREWLDRAEILALEELSKLMQDERRCPLTYNHYYSDNVQNDRLEAQRTAIKSAITIVVDDWRAKKQTSHYADINQLMSAIEPKVIVDMDEHACKEARRQLDAYYKVAMKTFVDNVARQVIERHIVSPLPRAFCPASIASLSEEELLRIGSEPEQQSMRRTRLSKEADELRKSLRELQKTM